MGKIKAICNFFGLLLAIHGQLWGQSLAELPTHPRGLIQQKEINGLREKIKNEPFKSLFESIRNEEQRLSGVAKGVYDVSTLAKYQAFIYMLTGEKSWALKTYSNITSLSEDTIFVRNPFSKGLTRAHVLRELVYAYDFCFEGFTDHQRQFVNNVLYDLMSSVNNNMGKMANYHLESNWMGVRYGSVVFAAVVLDDVYLDQSTEPKSVLPFLWDTQKRLQDHLNVAFTANGWFVESLGYQVYDCNFACPAIIALQNTFSSNATFYLENYAPNMVHALDQHITSIVKLQNGNSYGIKADLADDNPTIGLSQFAFGLRLFPEKLTPYLYWMVDYLKNEDVFQDDLLLLTLYSMDKESSNPASGRYLNYVDETTGVVFFRNRFQDENDIVACFNTSSKRFHGHAGPDNLTFRITGLGSLWVVGAGRTGEVAGQTNLFPDGNWQDQKGKNVESKLIEYVFEQDGSGSVIGAGSCMGVKNHTRKFAADYSGKAGAKAVFIISDSSENGKTWRLNTPEFNEVKILKNGFLLTTPNGSTLKGIVAGKQVVEVKVGKVRYGGSTQDHNPGIGFGGKYYSYNKTIDIACDGNITVIMTMQPKGDKHPNME